MSDLDPKRWAEADGGAPEALKSLLEGARADVPSAAELSPVKQALGPLLDVPIAGGTATSSGALSLGTGAGSALAYWLAGGAAVVLMGAGAWLLGGAPPSEAPSAPVQAPTVAPLERTSPRPSPKPESADAPLEMVEGSAPELPVPLPHASSPAPIRPKLAAPQKAPAPQQSEASLLEQARSLLATNPGKALALTRDHQRRFPNGVLSQEREVIAIDALSRLEREAEAEKRAKSFQERFPDSAHQRKVGDTLPGSSPKTPSKD